MSFKTVEIKISEEVYTLVKKMAEAGRGKGRGERTPCTIGEMAGDLVSTGAHRRVAANKWAKANAKPRKPRVAKKGARKPRVAKKGARKPRVAKKGALKANGAKKPASSSAAAPAASSVLD